MGLRYWWGCPDEEGRGWTVGRRGAPGEAGELASLKKGLNGPSRHSVEWGLQRPNKGVVEMYRERADRMLRRRSKLGCTSLGSSYFSRTRSSIAETSREPPAERMARVMNSWSLVSSGPRGEAAIAAAGAG